MILDGLFSAARERARRIVFPRQVTQPVRPSFVEALAGKGQVSVIAEFKRASPSLGDIAPQSRLIEQARIYANAGAAAMSVLTEPDHFHGSIEDLREASRAVDLPLLLKDFVVDPVQVHQAAILGASAVLLIVRGLDRNELRELAQACCEFGLTPLVECHDEAEIERALQIEEAVIGVNNRDLDTLVVDTARAPALLAEIPPGRIAVAESGYSQPSEIPELIGLADAVLIGSALMSSPDPTRFIQEISRCNR